MDNASIKRHRTSTSMSSIGKSGTVLVTGLLCLLILSTPHLLQGQTVVINEIRSYSGPSNPEFIELKGDPGTDLGSYTIEGIGGNDPQPYLTVDPTGTIPGDGYFLISGDAALSGVDYFHSGMNLYNQDANLVLKKGGSTVDAIAYVKDAGDTLEYSFGEGNPAVAPGFGKSIGRYPDGLDTGDNSTDFHEFDDPNPGASNGGEAGVINVTSPDGGEAWLPGSDQTIEWTWAGAIDSVKVHYSVDGGTAWSVITSGTVNDGSHPWTVPDAHSSTCLVKVADLDDDPSDVSDGYFRIGSEYTPIGYIQAYDEDGLSPMVGEVVKVKGIVTVPSDLFSDDRTSIYIQDDTGGINIFGWDVLSPKAGIGDSLIVTGEVEEYISGSSGGGATTEIVFDSAADVQNVSQGNPEPEPLELRTGYIEEAHEGLLVRTEGVIGSKSDYGMYIDDGSGEIQIYKNYNENLDFSPYFIGQRIEVVGVILQYDTKFPYLDGYEVVPRDNDDMQEVEVEFSESPVLSVTDRVFNPLIPALEGGVATITYNAPAQSTVTLRIFDLKGREVKIIYDGQSSGETEATWNGRDRYENIVSPGTYICFMETVYSSTGKRYTQSTPIVVAVPLK